MGIPFPPSCPKGNEGKAEADITNETLRTGWGVSPLPPVQIVPSISIEPGFFQSLLVVAPHPDDETIGAGGLIRAMRDLGRRVRVVVVSDGSASHDSQAFPPHALAALRRNETITAMARLGVDRDDIHFCDFEDGRSRYWDSDPRGIARLASAVYGHFDLCCLPSARDNHADHRKARELARKFMTGGGLNLDYLVWPHETETFPPAAGAEFALSPDIVSAKQDALRCYRSQLGAITDDPGGFTIDAPTFARFTATVERFTL